MTIENSRTYCLDKKGVEEAFTLDESTLVFNIGCASGFLNNFLLLYY